MGQKLREHQIAALADWVEMGAPWPEAPGAAVIPKDGEFVITPAQRGFWSFRPLQKTAPPQLKDKRAANYIDRYVLSKLQEEGLSPNPPADRLTLIRRASLDLTGLPPTPEEVYEFVNDKAPDAYEKLIERLLGSRRYGERWGRLWLDVVRYGEDEHSRSRQRPPGTREVPDGIPLP